MTGHVPGHVGEITHLGATICQPCPIRPLCRAYGNAVRPPAGIWAGAVYKPRKPRKPRNLDNPGNSRTGHAIEAGRVNHSNSSQPINIKENH